MGVDLRQTVQYFVPNTDNSITTTMIVINDGLPHDMFHDGATRILLNI